MNIRYETKLRNELSAQSVLELFLHAGISKPNWSTERMKRALTGNNVYLLKRKK